jgi:tetratricopeptide (TPR) repeat protein
MLSPAIRLTLPLWTAAALGQASVAASQEPSGYDPLGTALSESAEALAAGEGERALEAALRAESHAPRDPATLLALARALNLVGRHADVLEALAQVDAERIGSRLWVERGRAARALGEDELARKSFLAALDRYPAGGPARAALIELYFERGDLEQMGHHLERLRGQAPDLPWGVAMEGRWLAGQGRRSEARELLESALVADDELGTVRFALVELLLADRPERAFEVARAWLDGAPTVGATLLAGRAALAAGDGLAALEVGLRALRHEPSSGAALELATASLDLLGSPVERLLERRLATDPGDRRLRATLARRALDGGDPARALALVDADPALELAAAPREASVAGGERPLPDVGLELLAVEALRRGGRSEEARSRLDRVVSTRGATPESDYQLGWLELEAGRLDAAAQAFDGAASSSELRGRARYNQGAVLERAARFAESARAYEQALAADPSLTQAWVQLGNHYQFRLGERALAAEAYRRFLELEGEDVQVRAWLEEVSR